MRLLSQIPGYLLPGYRLLGYLAKRGVRACAGIPAARAPVLGAEPLNPCHDDHDSRCC